MTQSESFSRRRGSCGPGQIFRATTSDVISDTSQSDPKGIVLQDVGKGLQSIREYKSHKQSETIKKGLRQGDTFSYPVSANYFSTCAAPGRNQCFPAIRAATGTVELEGDAASHLNVTVSSLIFPLRAPQFAGVFSITFDVYAPVFMQLNLKKIPGSSSLEPGIKQDSTFFCSESVLRVTVLCLSKVRVVI